MRRVKISIKNIPALIWGESSDKVYLFVHGKMSSKEAAEELARIAQSKGYQTISFDLPCHGERAEEKERCDIWNGMRDLRIVADYVFANWKEVSLFASSLGAYFSLQTYQNDPFQKCLFQSPIVDMEYLIKQMMLWFDVSAERLEREKEVNTPIDVLVWDYYMYVKEHPITKWNSPIAILYGGKDNLQALDVLHKFVDQFSAELSVAENSEHAFMGAKDGEIVRKWLQKNI